MEGILIIIVVIVVVAFAVKDSLKEERTEEMATKDERLVSALEGIELTEQEERYLEWLSRMDGETIEVFAELFEKIKNRPSGG